jgi:hypothetical protein
VHKSLGPCGQTLTTQAQPGGIKLPDELISACHMIFLRTQNECRRRNYPQIN